MCNSMCSCACNLGISLHFWPDFLSAKKSKVRNCKIFNSGRDRVGCIYEENE